MNGTVTKRKYKRHCPAGAREAFLAAVTRLTPVPLELRRLSDAARVEVGRIMRRVSRAGISQSLIAEWCGVSQTTVSNMIMAANAVDRRR